MEVRALVVFACLFVLASASASAVYIDLGSYSVQDPRITVEYTEDVFLLSAQLVNLEPDADIPEFTLRQVPPKDPAAPTYLKTYYLYTGTQADPQYLTSGRHQLTLDALDRQGRPTLDIVEFTITGLDIVLIEPPFGYSPVSPFDLSFETQVDRDPEPASCWYSKVGWNSSRTRIEQEGTYTTDHEIAALAYNGYLYISCTESTGRETRERFTIGRDATAPSLNISVFPDVVTNPQDKSAVIRVFTDDLAVCEIDGTAFPGENRYSASSYRTAHELRRYYNEVTDTAYHEFDHEIACRNLAQLTADKTVTVAVNLGAYVGISVLAPSTPYVNTTSFTLRIRPSFDATSCVVNNQPMQAQQNEEWTSLFSAVSQGKIALNISCAGGGKNATLSHNITIDSQPPTIAGLRAISTICDDPKPSASIEWNATDALSGLASVEYAIAQGLLPLANGTTVLSRATATLPPDLTGTLTWSLVATDLAGNRGFAVTLDAVCGTNGTGPNGTIEYCFSDLDCAIGQVCDAFGMCKTSTGGPGDTCANGVLDTSEEDIDCGGECPACTVCFDDFECDLDHVCGPSGVCIPGGGPTSCASDLDCPFDKPVCQYGTCTVVTNPPPPPPPPGCTSDDECVAGTICTAGRCVLEPQKETDWLAIILIIVGLLIMGGVGWFLYQHDQEKRAAQAAMQRSRTVSQRPMQSPGTQPAPGAQRSAQQPSAPTTASPAARLPTARRVTPQDRAAQRKETLGAFGSTTESPTTKKQPPAPSAKQQPPQPQQKKKEGDEDDEDVFDSLEDIGKR